MSTTMDDSIGDVRHPKFKYVFIPRDMDSAVEEREFEGLEKDFKEYMSRHFATETFLEREKEKLSKDLLESTKTGALDAEYLNQAVELSQTCQIIPLTLPTKANHFDAVNAYIDNVGRVKNLPRNARASRITSDDIRGDCFLSRTYDDESVFKRVDFTREDYERFLANPPTSSGRWNQADALRQLQQQLAEGQPGGSVSGVPSTETTSSTKKRCAGCRNEDNLKACGRCLRVYYCSKECQKDDWKYHKRSCVS